MLRFRILKFLLLIVVFQFQGIALFSQNNAKKSLEAILIVGHQEDGTNEAIERIDKIAVLLADNGIVCHKFYNDEANWSEIIKVAPKCSFLVYSGHGSTMGVDGNFGGLCLNKMVSTETLLKELKLMPNALVLFQSVCGGAGSSAGDNGDIGVQTAKNRVYNYAYPFFEVGAGAYFANNYIDGCFEFLEKFLGGSTVQSAYNEVTEFWTKIEFETDVEGYLGKKISVASSDSKGTSTRITYTNGVKKVEQIPTSKRYSIAYSGNPLLTLSMIKK
jgi:hypothetical protein